MHYVVLHHWSKFQTNLTTFQWVTQIDSYVSVVQKVKFNKRKLSNEKDSYNKNCQKYSSVPNKRGVLTIGGGRGGGGRVENDAR